MTLQYTIELDHRVWIPIPLTFPWNGYDTDESWASDLASSLLTGFDAASAVRVQLETTALTLARTDGPLPGALERFWYFPELGGPERLVHLYISEYPDESGDDLTELARAGIGGFVQVLQPLADTGFARAIKAVVITSTDPGSPLGSHADDRTIFAERYLGLAGGMVFMLELIDQNAYVLQALEEPLEALFRSIRLRQG